MAALFSDGNAAPKAIETPASIEQVEVVTEFINAELDSYGCPPKAKKQLDIAIDEVFSNIANYAYRGSEGKARVEILFDKGEPGVGIRFIDNGVKYNPLAKDDPDITLSAEDRDIGGLGIYMTKMLTDDIDYEYKDGKNILTIIKRF